MLGSEVPRCLVLGDGATFETQTDVTQMDGAALFKPSGIFLPKSMGAR